MKHSLKIGLFVLLLCGVFGADEVKPVSVMEGDSVTLTPDPAKIQGFVKLQWRFGEKLIAQTRRTESSIEYEDIFKDRLQLDHKTGSLTFRNMRTKHSGPYQLQIDYSDTVPSYIKFSVTVKESPSVDAIEFVTKTESVIEGNPVILHVPQIQGDELIVWRFGEEGKLIAKHDIEAKNSSLYYNEERFRNRLQLDQTGSLTITNTSTTDSGLYTAKISSDKQTLYNRFIVTVDPVPGLSGGAVAGIVFGVLLLAVAVAAAVAGVMYYLRPRTTNLPNQTWSVPPADDVTLNPETEIQRGDEIQWLFGAEETLIAEIKGENREKTTYDGPDKRFKNRLELDETTGSLTIKNIGTEDTGLYTLKIRRGRETFYKRFIVSVRERMITVREGNPVFLFSDTDIQTDDEVQWLFGDKEQTVLTEIKNTEVTKYEGTDWRFRDRLELNEETGKLTITNFSAAHTGLYTLKITRGRDKIYKKIYILVEEKVEQKLLKGESVTLNPDTEIQREDQILWMFGYQDKLIAQMKGGTVEINDDFANKSFKNRLKLDEKTGSLTITDIEAEHTGLYKLQIISSRGILCKKFRVSIHLRYEAVTPGDYVHLYTGLPKIQRDDEIQWRFGNKNSLIAEIKGGTGVTHDVPDERFRDRLVLDKTTGVLIIKNSRAEHAGLYKVKISRSGGNTYWIYTVTIKDAAVTNEARTESLLKEKTDSRRNRVNESVTVEMEKDPLLNGEDVEEGTSSL